MKACGHDDPKSKYKLLCRACYAREYRKQLSPELRARVAARLKRYNATEAGQRAYLKTLENRKKKRRAERFQPFTSQTSRSASVSDS